MVSRTVPAIERLNLLLDDFGETQSGQKLNPLQKVCSELALRIRVNLEAVIPHFLRLDDGFINESLPISLVFRSVVSDILTFCYLCIFFDTTADPQNQPSLTNELDILDRDILKSFEGAMDLEADLAKIIPTLPKALSQEKIAEIRKQLREQIPALFRENGEFKSPGGLRTSSAAKYFNEGERGSPLTEKFKADKIQQFPIVDKFVVAHNIFRYFSQFQHYSRLTVHLMQKESERNRFYYVLTIDLVYMMFVLYFQLFDGPAKDKFLKEIQKQREDFEKIIS